MSRENSGAKILTSLAGDVTVQPREDEVTVREQLSLALTQDKVAQFL